MFTLTFNILTIMKRVLQVTKYLFQKHEKFWLDFDKLNTGGSDPVLSFLYTALAAGACLTNHTSFLRLTGLTGGV